MGVESGTLLPHQITVSSKLSDDFHPHDLSINSLTGWAPLVASTNEFIQVSTLIIRLFLQYRKITAGGDFGMSNSIHKGCLLCLPIS